MTEPVKLPEPWERQADESEEAWLAFRAYRDMPPDERQIKRAGIAAMSRLSKWYRDHNWYDRCLAYDATFDKIRIEERRAIYARKLQEITIDHMVMLADTRELVTREFAKLLEASRNSEMHGLIKPETLVKPADSVVKLDRLVRGESTENVQASNELDISRLSLDEIRVLNELTTKASRPAEPEEEETDVPRH